MIRMKLYGGLGNQLFQWAYAKSLSLDNNVEYVFDDSHYELCYKHFYALDRIPAIQNECKLSRDQVSKYRVQDSMTYRPLAELATDGDIYFDGFWQCDKYFKHNESEIRKLLTPQGGIKDRLQSRYGDKLVNSVSMHIRRNDYLTSDGFHPVMASSYYDKALSAVGPVDNILVFSDDIPWCKDTFNYDNMTFAEGNNNVEDLWLMSMCDHNIIANSSFSWWGSWLNCDIDKKVVAPSNWFGNANNNQQIYLDDWIVI